jgi:hypothetical protein
MLNKTIPNQTAQQTTAMVTRWATADSRYESVSKSELQTANPSLAREWDQFAKGKDTVPVSDLVNQLRQLSQKLNPAPQPQQITAPQNTADIA